MHANCMLLTVCYACQTEDHCNSNAIALQLHCIAIVLGYSLVYMVTKNHVSVVLEALHWS